MHANLRDDWTVYEAMNRRAHQTYLCEQGLIIAPRDQSGRTRPTRQVRRAGGLA